MADEKSATRSSFELAEVLYRTLSTSGSSKSIQKEAISLLCVKYGLKVIPNAMVAARPEINFGWATTRGPTEPIAPKTPKVPKGTKPKAAYNADPKVVAAKRALDAAMEAKNALLAEGRPIPAPMKESIAKLLSEWKAAKATAKGEGSNPLPEAEVAGQ